MEVIYEDENVLAYDKPAGVNADDIPGRVHRLDKDTSGILLVAKNDKSLDFLQEQFKKRRVEKKYIALATGKIKNGTGTIETLLGRSPKDRRKQRAFLSTEPTAENKRAAITEYKIIERFEGFTLLEITLKTGRKHQIRAHMAHLGHPIAGDKLYGFKGQSPPKNLGRQFLHANYLKITLPDGQEQTFSSPLPKDLKLVLSKLEGL